MISSNCARLLKGNKQCFRMDSVSLVLTCHQVMTVIQEMTRQDSEDEWWHLNKKKTGSKTPTTMSSVSAATATPPQTSKKPTSLAGWSDLVSPFNISLTRCPGKAG